MTRKFKVIKIPPKIHKNCKIEIGSIYEMREDGMYWADKCWLPFNAFYIENNPDFFEEVFEENKPHVIERHLKPGVCEKCGATVTISTMPHMPGASFKMDKTTFEFNGTTFIEKDWGHECKK